MELIWPLSYLSTSVDSHVKRELAVVAYPESVDRDQPTISIRSTDGVAAGSDEASSIDSSN